MSDRFRIGRALHRLLSGLVQVLDGFLRIATARVVMRQLVVVLFYPLVKELLDCLRGLFMPSFAAFDEYRVVRNLLCQSMLETVLYFRERRLLVEKFFVLE